MNKEVLPELVTGFEELIDKSNEINDLLSLWQQNHYALKKFEAMEESIRNKIKVFLKEHKWNSYKDDNSNISVSLTIRESKKLDKEKLKMLLSEGEYNEVFLISKYEVLSVITPEIRERLKQIVRKK